MWVAGAAVLKRIAAVAISAYLAAGLALFVGQDAMIFSPSDATGAPSDERISVDDALYAITLGAAYTLKLDQEVGSIEVGKRADFAVLKADPTTVGGDALKDIAVWGTVQDGRIFEAAKL